MDGNVTQTTSSVNSPQHLRAPNAPRHGVSRKADTRLLVIVPLILFGGLCTAVVPFGMKAPGFLAFLGIHPVVGDLTIIAKGDGTFDIAGVPDYWFAPTAVGGALTYAMQSRFGKTAKASEVNVFVKADAGASDDAIRAAIANARAHGFVRFGFTDPNLSKLAQASNPTK